MHDTSIKRIGIIGAGRVGTALARLAIAAGYEVAVASSSRPQDNALILEIMAPGAIAATVADGVKQSDLVVLALPLPRYRTLDPSLFPGKLVVDTMNFWAPTDGTVEGLTADRSSSEAVAAWLSGARLVRTLNHIGYHDLEADARPAGDPTRRALAIAGDDPAARESVAAFIDRLGYDPVDAGPLAAGRCFDVGTAIFSGAHRRTTLETLLAAGSYASQLSSNGANTAVNRPLSAMASPANVPAS